ncbi:histone deacetylase HDT2-like isoform X2 [Lolium rigidum]|uniref:histone deacetylase HDT2-like isoform X2 n=1 Tax=Lolium rigidum TaxID=89674 RepID=UPI001F5D4031|nr:histone deacetylase HDT2-like isoform X2 [Lolium rigidum]
MPSMEFFWGVEVKPGQTVSCDPEKGCILRVSQAALGETKKGTHNIVVSAEIDDQKVILGTLSAENRPQFPCDLIFHKEFELSHSSKTASVFVCGYRAVMPDQPEYGSSKDEGEVKTVNNQVTNPIAGEVKTVNNQVINSIADNLDSDEDDSDSSSLDDLTSSGDDLTEDESDSEDNSSEEDDTSTEEDDSSSEEIDTSSEEIATSSEEDSSDEDGKNTPVKPVDGKKRVAEFALKTLASDKKAKIGTPSGQATTGDKEVPHVATPHPSKQASKTSGNSKSKAKSTKSVGTHACKSCSKAFGSDSALQSHEKAKHT